MVAISCSVRPATGRANPQVSPRGLGQSKTLNHAGGLTKLIAETETGQILGAGIVGPEAGELIAEAVLAIEMGATATDLALTIHPHPTLSETLMEAAETFWGQSTHYRAARHARKSG